MRKQIQHALDTTLTDSELRKALIGILYQEPKKHTTPDLYWELYEFNSRSVSIIQRYLDRNGDINPTLEELADMISKEKLEAIAGCGANTITDVKTTFHKYKLTLK